MKRHAVLLLACLAAPAQSMADARSDAQAALKTHTKAAATARAQQKQDAAHATALAAQQVQAAAALRGLENQTAQAAAQLVNLQTAQTQTAAQLAQAEAALTRLLPLMQHLSDAPTASLLASPLSPGDAVRGIAIIQGVAAAIATQAQSVRTQAAELSQLTAAAQASQTRLTAAVAAQQNAETALSQQIDAAKSAEQADEDIAAKETAQALAAKHKLKTLDQAVANLIPKSAAPVNLQAGAGGAPVAGQIVQAYGAATLAGPATGVSYGAAPGARVVVPCAGTVMFAGAFPSYGLMVIADCGGGDSIVLAGMNHLDVAQGQRVAHGQPVGSMQSYDPSNPTRQPRLYVELRHNGVPMNPTTWLNGHGSG